MNRKTKIICTIGPASNSEEVLKKMIEAGMNVARINMSHGAPDTQRPVVQRIQKLRKQMGVPLAIMVDTKGPEVRIGVFETGFVTLIDGQRFALTTDEKAVCGGTIATVNYKNLHKDIKTGNRILLNDGLTELVVTDVAGQQINCRVVAGGIVSSRKGLFVPGAKLSMPFLSEADKADLKFACEMGAEYVAASFVSSKKDVEMMRAFLDANGGQEIEIISKIESATGLENIDDIIKASDAIMVARGDLGVEISIEKLPAIQKDLICKCKNYGKTVITATEMLETMITKLRPTRAEATDVANAVYDETSAVMLSGETAVGIDPVHVIKTMANICVEAEKTCNFEQCFKRFDYGIISATDMICHSACSCSFRLGVPVICASTMKGTTARRIANFRPGAPILALTPNEYVFHKLALVFGVVPYINKFMKTTDEMFRTAREIACDLRLAKKGDNIMITAGLPFADFAGTNLLKIEQA